MHGYSAREVNHFVICFDVLQSTCTGIVQEAPSVWQRARSVVAIYMHGYSASIDYTSCPLSCFVAIYMHGYSASIESSERSASIRVAIYMHGYSASSGAEVLFVIWLVAIYTWFRG